MKIAVDCRYIGKSGIGRVCEGILDAFDYSENKFYLIGKKALLEKYSQATIVEDDSEPYSAKGLFAFDKSLNKICDAMLIPNFLIPFGIKIPVFTIMHDLAFLDVKETTRGLFDKTVKKYLLKRCMKKSKGISCVSLFTLERCKHYYGRLADKCFVNYNGISQGVFEYARSHSVSKKRTNIVFVGNVKPHKGLKILLAAFSNVKDGSTLKIIGEKDHFLTGLELDESAYRNVIFTGKLENDALCSEIQQAKYLVLPSKYEGFGLPPLEALCLGTQPIVSDIPVFREVYEGLPVEFFSDENDLAQKLVREPTPVNCLEEIEARYHFKDCADKLIKALKNGIK